MDELDELLRPTWGAEKWILEGWNQTTTKEKALIKQRMQTLFANGLPFELKNDKLLYIYTFSFLAQLEVLAIQVPLKFGSKMSTKAYRDRMRLQLLDEIFHGLVFTKIVYMLCAPNAVPPPYNENVEILCNFIRDESCPKMAVMLLNLIGEGWIEEIFYSLKRQGIAPEVFTTIIDDEHRHVCEAELYHDIGMPDLALVKPKLDFLEEQLLTTIFMQYKYMSSIMTLLGIDGASDFVQSLNKKHLQQLQKINMQPSMNWQFFMRLSSELLPRIEVFSASNHEIKMTPIRKMFMTQWDNPSDPTMGGQFNVNVSCLDFFNKKFPPETLTTLMMQTVSKGLSETASFRSFLSFKKLYCAKEAYVGLVVKLPDCGDHIGTIVFENCHQFTLRELAVKIRTIMKMMIYCYKQREQLELLYPHLADMVDTGLYAFANDSYGYPIAGNPFVSLSNIGFCGYSQCVSPLRCNEPMKFTLMEVERKQVWNKKSQDFEIQDILPVSISADHRIFDGNLPVPKMVNAYFNQLFAKMIEDESSPQPPASSVDNTQLISLLEQLINKNVEMGYKALLVLQTYWFDFLLLEEILTNDIVKEAQAYYEEHALPIT